MDQDVVGKVGIGGALLAGLGAVLGVGRVWQKVETHDDLLKTMVPRTEFEDLTDRINNLHYDVREIRRSLGGGRYDGE